LFAGLIKEARVTYANGLYSLSADLVTGTYLLDMARVSRSFQDAGQTFEELFKDALERTPGAACLIKVSDRPAGVPFIQHDETDWEFARRLASHLGSSLVADMAGGEPWFYLGLPWGRERGAVGETFIEREIDWLSYWRLGGESSGYTLRDFTCYYVESEDIYGVGDTLLCKGESLRVCGYEAATRQSALIFRYQLGTPARLARRVIYNERLQGASFTGAVLETRREDIRIHLDIDEGRPDKSAYFYPWLPDTGDALYLTPEVGDRVELTVWGIDEAVASAGIASRAGAGDNPLIADPDRRGLVTKGNKRLSLAPGQISVEGDRGKKAAPRLTLLDDAGVGVATKGAVTIVAAGRLTLSARDVRVDAATSLTLERVGGEPGDERAVAEAAAPVGERIKAAPPVSRVSLWAGGRVSVEGERTLWAGREYQPYGAYDDDPKKRRGARHPRWGDRMGLLGLVAMAARPSAVSPSDMALLASLPLSVSAGEPAQAPQAPRGGRGGGANARLIGSWMGSETMVSGAGGGPTVKVSVPLYTGSGLEDTAPGSGSALGNANAGRHKFGGAALEDERRAAVAGQLQREFGFDEKTADIVMKVHKLINEDASKSQAERDWEFARAISQLTYDKGDWMDERWWWRGAAPSTRNMGRPRRILLAWG
jgi:hypothetical protein